MFRFRYVNTEGFEVSLGMEAPFLVTHKEGLGAVANNITTQTQYNMAGAMYVNQQLAVREIKITGEILAESGEDMQLLRKQMIAAFNPELAGTLYYIVDNETYMVDVLVEVAPDLDAKQKNLALEYSIQLKALDPYWADMTTYDKLISLSGLQNNLTFPMRITNTFTFASIITGVIQTIKNGGDVAVGAEFTFNVNAPARDIKILNVETQEYFGFAGNYSAGTVLRLNTKRNSKQATLKMPDGTVKNAMAQRMDGSTFFSLKKGDNFIQVLADAGQENIITDMRFNPLVLGV